MPKIAQLHKTKIQYRGQTIKLTHRPKVNDWKYEIILSRVIRISDTQVRYGAAVEAAKTAIDLFTKYD